MSNERWVTHLGQWQRFLEERARRADALGERIRIERQRRALEATRYAAVLNPRLLTELIEPTEKPVYKGEELTHQLALNDSQKKAVALALSGNVLSLIQGPPGTGKTQVITEICLQLYKKDPNVRILICSETHVAVNNLVARLAACNDSIRIVRIRDKEQDGSSDEYSPAAIVDRYARELHGLLDDELAELIIETVARHDDRSLEKALALSANVVGMTCNRVGAYAFDASAERFDVAIIDEVCKATLPEILMPLGVAEKAILVGDPKQLPPVFCSEELDVIRSIEDCELQRYMYIDQLFTRSRCVTRLDTQYRMAEKIGALVSELFYEGTLKNGRTPAAQGVLRWLDYRPSQPWPPVTDEEEQRVYNLEECALAASLLRRLDDEVDEEREVAVIAPYREQVRRLRETIRALGLKHIRVRADTVDGFQGKECDVVVFSLTRTHGSYRFLADRRRLNVALSRAKERIYMLGCLSYAREHRLLDEIASACEIEHDSLQETDLRTP